MKIVNGQAAAAVTLTEPSAGGYLVLAAEIGGWAGPFVLPSRRRERVLARAVHLCAELAARDDVLEAVVFRGVLRPPGEGAEILARAGALPARFDVVILVITRGLDDLDEVRDDAAYRALSTEICSTAEQSYRVAAGNAARIADVDHRRDDWFLFNYFHCDDADIVSAVWRYTAGWFQRHTALPNSTLLRPLPGEDGDFGIVNHASWPRLRSFLPALLFSPGFRTFVLANFKANGVAAQPIMYRQARRGAATGH